jgi:hypothetical protein
MSPRFVIRCAMLQATHFLARSIQPLKERTWSFAIVHSSHVLLLCHTEYLCGHSSNVGRTTSSGITTLEVVDKGAFRRPELCIRADGDDTSVDYPACPIPCGLLYKRSRLHPGDFVPLGPGSGESKTTPPASCTILSPDYIHPKRYCSIAYISQLDRRDYIPIRAES